MVLLHACTLEDLSFVGMNSTNMDGAVVKQGETAKKNKNR